MSVILRNPRRSQLSIAILVGVLLLASLLSGCQRASRQDGADQAPDVQVTLAVEPDPPAAGPARLIVTLKDNAGQPVEGAAVQVRGDMSHAGMRPEQAEATATGDGVYEADLAWTMSGDWIVTITATLPDGRVATREFDVKVSAS